MTIKLDYVFTYQSRHHEKRKKGLAGLGQQGLACQKQGKSYIPDDRFYNQLVCWIILGLDTFSCIIILTTFVSLCFFIIFIFPVNEYNSIGRFDKSEGYDITTLKVQI